MWQMAVGLFLICAAFPTLQAAEPTPEIDWLVEEAPGQGLSNPLFTNGLVVVGNDAGDVRALDAKTGADVWRYPYGARVHRRPECDARHIYVVSDDRGLIALDRDHGSVAWERPSQNGFGSVSISTSANLLFAGGNDGFIRAFDTATGAERWATNILKDAPADRPGFEGKKARFGRILARQAAATCDGEWVFVCLADQSRVVGLDITDGTKKFEYQAGGWVFGAPLIDRVRVFIGSQDRALHCVDRATSKLVWSFMTSGDIGGTPAGDERQLYFGSCDGGFYCIDRQSGEELWKFDVETEGKRTTAINSNPLLIESAVCFAAGEGQVYALDRKTGKLLWKFRPVEDSRLFSSPISDGKRIFVTTSNSNEKGVLVAIDPYFGQ